MGMGVVSMDMGVLSMDMGVVSMDMGVVSMDSRVVSLWIWGFVSMDMGGGGLCLDIGLYLWIWGLCPGIIWDFCLDQACVSLSVCGYRDSIYCLGYVSMDMAIVSMNMGL